jgi:hypothetical protein
MELEMKKVFLILILITGSDLFLFGQFYDSIWNSAIDTENRALDEYNEANSILENSSYRFPTRTESDLRNGIEELGDIYSNLLNAQTLADRSWRNFRSASASWRSLASLASELNNSVDARNARRYASETSDNADNAIALKENITDFINTVRENLRELRVRLNDLVADRERREEAERRAAEQQQLEEEQEREAFLAVLNQDEYNPYSVEITNSIEDRWSDFAKENEFRIVTWVNETSENLVLFLLTYDPESQESDYTAEWEKELIINGSSDGHNESWYGWWGTFKILNPGNGISYFVKNRQVYWFAYNPSGPWWDIVGTEIWGSNEYRYKFPGERIDALVETTYPFNRTDLNIGYGEEVGIFIEPK